MSDGVLRRLAEAAGSLTWQDVAGAVRAEPVGDLLLFFFWHAAIVVPGAVALMVLERFGRALVARRWSQAGVRLVQFVLLAAVTAAAAAGFMHQLAVLQGRPR